MLLTRTTVRSGACRHECFLRPIQTKREESLTQSLRNFFTTRTTKRREPLRRDPSRVADKRSEDARIVSVCCVWQPDAMGRARGRTVTAPHSLRLQPRRQLDPSQNRLVLWCFGAQKQPRMSRRRGQEAKASIEHKARSARPKNPYSFEVFQNFTYRQTSCTKTLCPAFECSDSSKRFACLDQELAPDYSFNRSPGSLL